MRRTRSVLALAWVCGVLLAMSGCSRTSAGADTPDDGRLSVVAAFYPLQYAAEQVGGDLVDVTSLTPAGVEPHDLELTAAQVAEIADADVVLYVRGFQPAVDEAVDQQAGDRALDAADAVEVIGDDPHIWLDPTNMAAIGSLLADHLIELAPDDSAAVNANTDSLVAAMLSLNADFTHDLATCASRDLVVSHEAFGYLAAAYHLTQVPIFGLAPDAEPSPARLREVADFVREHGVTTIFHETLVDPKVAQTVADETGVAIAVLDPLEGLRPGSSGDFVSVMRENLAALVTGLRCT